VLCGALVLSGLLACAESGSAGSVELFSWVPGCCGLERNAYKTSRSSPWLAFFLATDLILGTDRFGLANQLVLSIKHQLAQWRGVGKF
jgi:hypothetical protein